MGKNPRTMRFYFNPRSREGSDKVDALNQRIAEQFQSALPRGERQQAQEDCQEINNFNPRSREGSDIT